MASIEITSKDEKQVVATLKGIPLQYANALRRICLNGVMIFAIDKIDVIENTSSIPDEGLAHRLGLIPLRTDLAEFKDPSKIDVNDSTNRVMLVLDEQTEKVRTIVSGDISSQDSFVKPASPNIPIVQLAPGQKVKLEAYAILGRGSDHAKWNASNIAVLTEGKQDDEHVLTVETSGALEPEQIIAASVVELRSRMEAFGELLKSMPSPAAA